MSDATSQPSDNQNNLPTETGSTTAKDAPSTQASPTIVPNDWDVAIIRSPLFGGGKGNAFDDVGAITGYPKRLFRIDVDRPILDITVMHGDVVDGIKITYRKFDGQTETITHGTSEYATQSAPNLKKDVIDLSGKASIIAVSGKHGPVDNPQWGSRVTQLSFVVYDASTGQTETKGPYGRGKFGNTFRSTANGKIIAIGGFAVNSNSSIGSISGGNTGLHGLTFAQVGWQTLADN